MYRILLLAILAVLLAVPAQAASFKFVIENGGGYYTSAESGNNLSLVGIRKLSGPGLDMFDFDEILGQKRAGNAIAFYEAETFKPLDSDSIFDFSGKTDVRPLFYVEWDGSNVVFNHKGFGGTATAGKGGGFLGEVSTKPVPLPGAAWLLLPALAGLLSYRKVRG